MQIDVNMYLFDLNIYFCQMTGKKRSLIESSVTIKYLSLLFIDNFLHSILPANSDSLVTSNNTRALMFIKINIDVLGKIGFTHVWNGIFSNE